MRKFYFFSLFLLALTSVTNAQVVKHFTEADTAVNSWWVNDGAVSGWQLTTCGDVDGYYALFTADLSLVADGGTYGAWNWATDIKLSDVDIPDAGVQDAINNAQSKLWLNFYINLFDGINANDSLGFSFELNTPSGGIGWPGATIKPIGEGWNWVSVDISGLDFGGIVPGDAESIDLIKFAIQPTKAYEKQDAMFKFGLQDIAISKGAMDAPATAPCALASSVSSISLDSELDVYPNPTKSVLNFKELTSGTVSDISGRQVLTFDNALKINIESLKAGLYVVNTGKQAVRVIKEE